MVLIIKVLIETIIMLLVEPFKLNEYNKKEEEEEEEVGGCS